MNQPTIIVVALCQWGWIPLRISVMIILNFAYNFF